MVKYRDSIEREIEQLEQRKDLGSWSYLVHHARLYLNLGNLSEARRLIDKTKEEVNQTHNERLTRSIPIINQYTRFPKR